MSNLLKIGSDREFPLVVTKVPQTYGIVEKSSRQFVLGLRGVRPLTMDGKLCSWVQFSSAQHSTGQDSSAHCAVF